MKYFYSLIIFILATSTSIAQNLHDDSNAVSPLNESNGTMGWSGLADLFSETSDVQNGIYSIRAVSTATDGRTLDYNFNAVVGQQYVIRIWAKIGTLTSPTVSPAFAVWSGMSGFNVTPITSTTWTEYVFNVTATSTNPRIRIYTSNYPFRLVAGNTIYIDNVSITALDNQAPTSPSNLVATATTETTTNLSWTAATDNIGVSNYEVFQDGISVGLTGGATSFVVTNLNPETTYTYTISAIDNSNNVSVQSSSVEVTTLTLSDTEIPSMPTGIVADNITTTGISLNWTAATDNVAVTDYEVFQEGVSIGFTGGATTYAVSGLAPETTYNFTIAAIDAAANSSAQSNNLLVTTLTLPDTEAPTVPTALIASSITTTSITLNWTAATDNVAVTDYEVFQEGVSLGLSGGTTTFFVDGLTPETAYNFTVTALDAASNTSGQSTSVSVNTLAIPDTEAPTIPTNLVADNITTTSVNLSWTAATDNTEVVDYEIFQDGVAIGLSSGSVVFAVNGLTPETTYNFTITALDGAANSSAVSESISVLTLAVSDTEVPTVPEGLLATNTTETSTELSWDAAMDNVGVVDYQIFQDGSAIGLTGGATSYVVSGLASETNYVFTIAALDVANNASLQSSELAVVTLAAVQPEINYTSLNSNLTTVDWTARDLYAAQNVGIGTTDTQGYRLAVAGNVVAEEVKVALQVNWPDYVFDKAYNLPSLEQVENHINENGYLIHMPSASEVEENGIQLGEMNAKLLRKIEELTLYTITQEKKIKLLEQQVAAIQKALSNK
ncbi:fibronectin type III domain-containing protein [Cellulophaga sp. HaHa_2_95]|uniref:fibronectin type III domain-containing protein n=1 Tax=Cellulophaga sp. HaHa_2_95 TaxID=2745558 RepID=UPI001C4F0515|nr:fibronectin type III domain-containing protein [Cellulophaga sp. HaHa_2_95]QXP55255.1 fibronectin type III domain-containing protein [Cellulophaga sp. HaHa_2_95]